MQVRSVCGVSGAATVYSPTVAMLLTQAEFLSPGSTDGESTLVLVSGGTQRHLWWCRPVGS